MDMYTTHTCTYVVIRTNTLYTIKTLFVYVHIHTHNYTCINHIRVHACTHSCTATPKYIYIHAQ